MKQEQTGNIINKEKASEIVNILINIYYLTLEFFKIWVLKANMTLFIGFQ